ncbi:MAG: hypothetical protein ACRDRA_11460 [Pseudonocardiaceae bacterium]
MPSVASWSLRGRPPTAHPGFWRTADELVKAVGAVLAGCEQVQAAKQEHEVRSREAELAKAYAEAQALRATTSCPQYGLLALVSPSSTRELLAGPSTALLSNSATPERHHNVDTPTLQLPLDRF